VINEDLVHEPEEVDYTKIDLGPYSSFDNSSDTDRGTSTREYNGRNGHRADDHDTSYTSEEDEDEPVIYEAAAATTRTPQINLVKAKGSLVTIPRRVPPPLPPRHPMRSSGVEQASVGSQTSSPLKDGFEEVELNGQRVDTMAERRVDSPIVLVNGVEEETTNEEKVEEEKVNEEKVEEENANKEKVEEAKANEEKVEEEKANEEQVTEEKANGDEVEEKEGKGDKVEEVKTIDDTSLVESVENGAEHTGFAHSEPEPGKLESEKNLSEEPDSKEDEEEKKVPAHTDRVSTDSAVEKADGTDDFHSLPETPVEGSNQWA